MEKKAQNIKHEILNEESILKHQNKNSDNKEMINKSTNDASHIPIQTEINDVNFKLEYLNIDKKENHSNEENSENISKVSVRTQYKIFIPFSVIKITLPTFLMFKYLVYAIKNKEDQDYCKYSVFVLSSYVLFCYFLVVFTKSSQTNVNKYFTQDVFTYKTGSPGSEIQDLNQLDWNECKFCKSKKFMRCSHCRICNKCILMRDHHCPYVANCIGFKNIQYFFNFVFWGNIANIYYISIFIYFMFISDVKINIPFYIYILLYIDLFVNCFFIFNLNGILLRLLMTVYNNWTQKEHFSNPLTENECPIHCCCGVNGKKNEEIMDINFYNIGFLAHLYHLVGPTILHFLFPLPKYKNYNLDENSQIFKRICLPNRFEIFRYMVRKDPSQMALLTGENTSPNSYIKFCHEYYDGKKII